MFLTILALAFILIGFLLYPSNLFKWVIGIGVSLLSISIIKMKEFKDVFNYKLMQFYAENLGIAVIGGGLVASVISDKTTALGIIIAGIVILVSGIWFRAKVYKFEIESESGYIKYKKRKNLKK